MALAVLGVVLLLSSALGAVVDPYIVHGEIADQGEFPHQVSLQRHQKLLFWSWNEHVCGGTVLTSQWVLTAAHCYQGEKAVMYVVAGVNHLKKDKGQSVLADRFLVHERWNAFGNNVGPFDIALVHLAEPLQLGSAVHPAVLPAPNTIPQGEATLSGWGYVSNGLFPATKELHKMTVPLLDFATCKDAITDILNGGRNQLVDTNLCTSAGEKGNKAPCSGDSGGPLVQRDGSQVTLIGLVSWGFKPCGRSGHPSVYTRVSAYVDWIHDKMNGSNL